MAILPVQVFVQIFKMIIVFGFLPDRFKRTRSLSFVCKLWREIFLRNKLVHIMGGILSRGHMKAFLSPRGPHRNFKYIVHLDIFIPTLFTEAKMLRHHVKECRAQKTIGLHEQAALFHNFKSQYGRVQDEVLKDFRKILPRLVKLQTLILAVEMPQTAEAAVHFTGYIEIDDRKHARLIRTALSDHIWWIRTQVDEEARMIKHAICRHGAKCEVEGFIFSEIW